METLDRTVVVDGGQLATEVWPGAPDAPTVLLIAGTSSSRDWWPPELCELLARSGSSVIRYDQRDTGDSTVWPIGVPGYGLPTLVDDAVAVLDSAVAVRAHVVGISQGGWVAQLLAVDHPDRVASLTLIATRSTAHGDADADLPEVSDELMQAWNALEQPDWDDRTSIVEYLVESERALAGDSFDSEEARAVARAVVARRADIRAAENHLAADQGPRWRHRLAELSVPTAVIHGELDPLFPPRNGEALAAEIPGARLHLVLGMGHGLPRSVWPLVEAVVSGFTSARGDGHGMLTG